jgi:hypothetical protein
MDQTFFEDCIRHVTHATRTTGGKARKTKKFETEEELTYDKETHRLVFAEFHLSVDKEISNLILKHEITNRDSLIIMPAIKSLINSQ